LQFRYIKVLHLLFIRKVNNTSIRKLMREEKSEPSNLKIHPFENADPQYYRDPVVYGGDIVYAESNFSSFHEYPLINRHYNKDNRMTRYDTISKHHRGPI